jgi:hypothetical protein
MSENKRLEQLRQILKIEKENFAQILKYSNYRSLQSAINRSNTISMKILREIKSYKPNINLNWLIANQGNMFLDEESKKINQGSNNNIQVAQGTSNTQSNGSSAELQIQVENLTKELKLAQEKIITLQEKLIDTLEKK